MKSTGKIDRTALTDRDDNVRDNHRKAGKVRIKVPPSIRQKEARMRSEVKAWLNGESPLDPDADNLVKQVLAGEHPFIHGMASKFEAALIEENWQTVSDMLDGFEEHGFRFDTAPVSDVYAGKYVALTAAVRVLTRPDQISDAEASLAIRLLKLGCNPNATDNEGNTLLMRACRAGNEQIVTHILTHCPGADLHQRNDQGQDALALAQDKPRLLQMLSQAGIQS